MEQIRCGQCARKLAEGIYTKLSIKCPRCKTLNQFNHASRTPDYSARRERLNLNQKETHDDENINPNPNQTASEN